MPVQNCGICDISFWVKQSFADKGRGKFCSKQCADLGKITKIVKICPQCNKEFSIHLSKIKQSTNSSPCCSLTCGTTYRYARTLTDRFLSRVFVLPGPNACWLWTGSSCRGYGNIKINGKHVLASHFSYRYFREPLKEGEIIRHVVCDNPPCVNPNHIAPGSDWDNAQDSIKKGRRYSILKYNDVVEILNHPEIPIKELESKYGVKYQAIYEIRRGWKWKHVPRPPRHIAISS